MIYWSLGNSNATVTCVFKIKVIIDCLFSPVACEFSLLFFFLHIPISDSRLDRLCSGDSCIRTVSAATLSARVPDVNTVFIQRTSDLFVFSLSGKQKYQNTEDLLFRNSLQFHLYVALLICKPTI